MNLVWNACRLAFLAILRSKMRAALTVLGVLIGVAAVVGVVTLASGASAKIGGQIQGFGTNLIYVFPKPLQKSGAKSQSSGRLYESDAKMIKREASSVAELTPWMSSSGQVIYEENNWSTTLSGVNREYLKVRNYEIEQGSMWSAEDEALGVKVCVMGRTVSNALFKGIDPVGRTVRVSGAPFRVIGLLAERGTSAFGEDQDDRVLVPLRTFRARINRQSSDRIDFIMLSATSEKTVWRAQEQIRSILRQKHKLRDEDEDDFSLNSQAEMLEMQEKISSTLSVMLLGVALVSLLVGGIGVMNIMLVSVAERTREIGIRMSIGGRSRDILVQFLVESIFLTLFGGFLGTVVGGLGTSLAGSLFDFPLTPPLYSIAIAVGTSCFIGVVFGFLPASRASKLDPIDALRSE